MHLVGLGTGGGQAVPSGPAGIHALGDKAFVHRHPGRHAVQHGADGRAVALAENSQRKGAAKGVFHASASSPSKVGRAAAGTVSVRQQPRPGTLIRVIGLPGPFCRGASLPAPSACRSWPAAADPGGGRPPAPAFAGSWIDHGQHTQGHTFPMVQAGGAAALDAPHGLDAVAQRVAEVQRLAHTLLGLVLLDDVLFEPQAAVDDLVNAGVYVPLLKDAEQLRVGQQSGFYRLGQAVDEVALGQGGQGVRVHDRPVWAARRCPRCFWCRPGPPPSYPQWRSRSWIRWWWDS